MNVAEEELFDNVIGQMFALEQLGDDVASALVAWGVYTALGVDTKIKVWQQYLAMVWKVGRQGLNTPQVHQGTNGQWYWRLRNNENGKFVAAGGEGFTTEQHAWRAVYEALMNTDLAVIAAHYVEEGGEDMETDPNAPQPDPNAPAEGGEGTGEGTDGGDDAQS